jgi:hypothetical protein
MQLALGTFLIVLGVGWICAVLFSAAPAKIPPTNDDVRQAYEAFLNAAGAAADLSSLGAVGTAILNGLLLALLDILFVVVRYGGITLSVVGGYAVFEAISSLRPGRP